MEGRERWYTELPYLPRVEAGDDDGDAPSS